MQHTEPKGVSRRRLLAMAGLSVGTTIFAQHPLFAEAGANSPTVDATASPETTSFSSLKQIDAGLLYDCRGVGHNLPQEAPEAFAKAVVDVDR